MRFWMGLLGLSCLMLPYRGSPSSVVPASIETQLDRAIGFCRGRVAALACYRANDGSIWTQATLRVDEPIKGRFPKKLTLHFRGGRLADEGEVCGLSPNLAIGEERLFLLWKEPDGRLTTFNGAGGAWPLERGRDGRLLPRAKHLLDTARARGRATPSALRETLIQDSATYASGVVGIYTNSGAPSRFLAPDRGEAIPCYLDMQALPAGITSNQALAAISNALTAWAGTSSLQWAVVTITNFGTSALSFATNENSGRLHIQMHDLYDVVNSPGVLGIGGRWFVTSPSFANGGLGGNVLGTEFFPTSRGYVILEHTDAALQNADNLAEVLCHEIGHALGLRHSSENPSESDPVLADAMMYYRLHAGGRGATLGAYDPPILEQVHPRTNTPPWTYARVMDVVATSPQTNGLAFNEIVACGYDLQNNALSLLITNGTSNYGSFSTIDQRLRFNPSSTSILPRIEPSENSYYDLVYVRSSDGTNCSPWTHVRIISRSRDSFPAGAPDGMPDNWMTTYFGTANPGSSPSLSSSGDYDGDGLCNIDEFRGGFDPTDPGSRFAISSFSLSNLAWQARPYELYEIHRSTNLIDWVRHGAPQSPTGAVENTSITHDPSSRASFFHVLRVP